MSYCRWSSDGFRSDVYVYESVYDCWTVHVAGRRRIGLDTLPQDPYDLLANCKSKEDIPENWQDIYRAYHDALRALPMEDINLPYAGKTFDLPTPGEAASKLRE